MPQLHYYRCRDCLSIATAEDYKPAAICSHCDGRLSYMGRVQRARLVVTEDVCKCDGRCTFARGPSCDCSCGGANHGAGWIGGGFITVDSDRGPVPRLRMPDNRQAAAIAAEWREAYAAICEAARLARGDWSRYYKLSEAATRSRSSKCHKHRMKLICDALPNYCAATTRESQFVLF